jgi:thiamine-phosphate pyrophosphorylase
MDSGVGRIVDANGNRTREALRVVEEYARFVLSDSDLTERLKSFRHGLADAMGTRGFDRIIQARDVRDDVGTRIETASEYSRKNMADVVAAGLKRASEGLRVLEECAKTFDADVARVFERLRYGWYDIERSVQVRLHSSARWGRVRLYVIITEAFCRGDWLAVARAAIEGGADCVQLREKSLSDAELITRATLLSAMCRDRDVLCVVNDRPDVALLSGADGVHVGQDDMTIRQARRVVRPGMVVGVSTHTVDQARAAMTNDPDYIAVGPMFATATKPVEPEAGLGLIDEVVKLTSLPVVAIGGINESTVDDVLAAGAERVCVCSAVTAAEDPLVATRRLRDRLTIHRRERATNHRAECGTHETSDRG